MSKADRIERGREVKAARRREAFAVEYMALVNKHRCFIDYSGWERDGDPYVRAEHEYEAEFARHAHNLKTKRSD